MNGEDGNGFLYGVGKMDNMTPQSNNRAGLVNNIYVKFTFH